MKPSVIFTAAALAASPIAASAASMLGDEVDVTVDSAFGTAISGTATVGPGIELAGSNVFHDYVVDLDLGSITVIVTKPVTAGNFTGILDTVVIDRLDHLVTGVSFNAAASSAFSSGNPDSIDLNTPGRIVIDFAGFASANTPASALRHSFTWDVTLSDEPVPAVPEPQTWALMALGLATLATARLRQRRRG
jgi:hypothetical protein